MPTRSVISAISVEAQSPQQLCQMLADELTALSPREGLTLHPWDGAHPESCLWWAVPTPEWPAFHLPKMFVDWLHPDDHATLYFGLHVEKGLGGSREQGSNGIGRLLMDAGWAWPQFTRDLANGRIGRLVRAVSSPAVPSLYLRVEVSNEIRADKALLRARRLWRDGAYYGFECRGRDARLALLYAHDSEGLGAPLEHAQTLPELAAALERLPGAAHRWVDLQLGVGAVVWAPEMDVKAISLRHLVARYVEAFAAWVAGVGSVENRQSR